MKTRFSEDVVPLADVKANPGKLVRQVSDQNRPVLLTSRGRGVAVLQSVEAFEAREEQINFMRAVVKGLAELDSGAEVTLDHAKAQLGLK